MLNFDERHYVDTETGAVALAGPIHDALRHELDAGLENIFFAGAGGVAFLALPAARILQTKSTFPTFVEMAAELVQTDNANLGPRSLVVLPSVSGTTKEAVEALRFAKSKGARVMTLTGTAGTPLAELADINFQNDVADDTSSENFLLQTLFIAMSIMRLRGEFDGYDEAVAELANMPAIMVEVKREFDARAKELAQEIKNEDYHILTGAGGTWYAAWYYGMCILEEMQWIRTRPVHASDFFHGTLELVEAGTSVWVFKGEDECRPLAERVERFVPTVSQKMRVFDTKEFTLTGLSEPVRALVSPIVFAAALERLSAHLEVVRDHPLTTRRYYRKVDY